MPTRRFALDHLGAYRAARSTSPATIAPSALHVRHERCCRASTIAMTSATTAAASGCFTGEDNAIGSVRPSVSTTSFELTISDVDRVHVYGS